MNSNITNENIKEKAGKITPTLSEDEDYKEIINPFKLNNDTNIGQAKETPKQGTTITKKYSDYAPKKHQYSLSSSPASFSDSSFALELKPTELGTNVQSIPNNLSETKNNLSKSSSNSFFSHNYRSKSLSSKPSLNSIKSRNELVKYKEEVLGIKTYKEDLIQYQDGVYILPPDKYNDENYKILAIQRNVKNVTNNNYKSAKAYDQDFFKSGKNLESQLNFSILRKKKIGLTPQKHFCIPVSMYNKNLEETVFPLFDDNEIGINSLWQEPLIENRADEDVDTDEEQLDLANHLIVHHIKEAFEFIRKNGKKALSGNSDSDE